MLSADRPQLDLIQPSMDHTTRALTIAPTRLMELLRLIVKSHVKYFIIDVNFVSHVLYGINIFIGLLVSQTLFYIRFCMLLKIPYFFI